MSSFLVSTPNFLLVYSLCIGLLQILSTFLCVQVLVVVSGTSPHVPHNHGGNDDIKGLIFRSSEGVENCIISSTFHRSGGKWGDGVLRDVLLLGSTHGSPPSHIRFWSRSSSHDDMLVMKEMKRDYWRSNGVCAGAKRAKWVENEKENMRENGY